MSYQPIPEELYREFFAVIERGDEAAARQFLIDNLNKFPPEVKDQLILVFFQEAVEKASREESSLAEVREKAIEILNELGMTKQEIEKKLKLLEIKESL